MFARFKHSPYLCNVQNQVGRKMSPVIGGFFIASKREILSLQHRVGSLDNTPKAFLLDSLNSA